MNRFLSAAAAAALGLTLLAGCGGDDGGSSAADDGGDYCGDLKKAASSIEAVTGGDLGSFEETTQQIHTLRDEAPDAVAGDWKLVSDAIDKVVAALKKAGIDEDDLAKLQNGDASLPPDVDLEALQEAMTEIQAMASDDLSKAGESIADHAKAECDVDLNAG